MRKRAFMKTYVVSVLAFTAALMALLAYNTFHFEEKEYQLSEVESGIYCIYNAVSSNIPAENYKMVTLCCNGRIATFKGTVTITYTATNPRAVVKDYNIVNGDQIMVFVPRDTVKFQENIGIG